MNCASAFSPFFHLKLTTRRIPKLECSYIFDWFFSSLICFLYMWKLNKMFPFDILLWCTCLNWNYSFKIILCNSTHCEWFLTKKRNSSPGVITPGLKGFYFSIFPGFSISVENIGSSEKHGYEWWSFPYIARVLWSKGVEVQLVNRHWRTNTGPW